MFRRWSPSGDPWTHPGVGPPFSAKMASILQWNCRGLISNWAESKIFFLLVAPIIIAVQETWFLPTDPYNFTLFNYTLYRYDETDGERRHGGAALYINNDYVQQQITLNTPLQAVACTIRLNGRNIDICSIYIPPNADNSTLERDLNNLISQFEHPFVLLGDFNAHSPMWGRNTRASDNRGDIIEQFLDNHQLVLLNKGDNTHFSLTHNSESAIDLSICSPQICSLFDWSVDSDIYHSDHYPIKIHTTFNSDNDATPGSIPRWNFRKADWTKFQEFCHIEHDQFVSPEQGIEFLTNTILTAANNTIPLSRPPRRKPVPWWSAEVAQAIARRKRAFRRYLRHRDESTLITRNRERSRCKRIIKEAKRSSWQSFITQFNHNTPLSRIWSLVRSLAGRRTVTSLPVLQVNGNKITEPKEILNTIAESFAHCSSSENYRQGFIEQSRTLHRLPPDAFISDNTEAYNNLFTMSELREAISSTGNTSIGPDKLHYAFFRQLPESAMQFMLRTMNNLYSQHVFPAAWKEAIVIPLPKPGKDRKNPANYRPISLTSCLGKLLERMVGKRLTWYLETNNLISKNQSGFRKNHTTYDHIIRIETDIRKGFKSKKTTTAVFLDISRAYDMVHKPVLISKLHKMGIRGHLAYYLIGFLSGESRFQVRSRSIHSNTYSLQNGLPQGSCISPTLFNIMINDLFDTVPPNINYSLFADDCSIWCTDADSEHSVPRLQSALDRIDDWARKNGCIFSPSKSAVVIFSKNNKMRQTESQLSISQNTMPYVSSFKFLGIVLDSRLSMVKHIEYIKTKCNARLNLFRCIAGIDFGADRKTLLQLYRSLVRPIIEYGAVIYAAASENQLKKVETIQNTFIRIALGVMKTSPIPSLQVESGIQPLYFRRVEQSLRYTNKIMFHPHHNTFKSLHILPSIHHGRIAPAEKRSGLTIASRIKKFSTELEYVQPEIRPQRRCNIPPWQMKDRNVTFLLEQPKTLTTQEDIQQKFLEFRDRFHNFHFIFTDGSKDGDRTSNSIYCSGSQQTKQFRLPNNTSIFIAEMHALLQALKYIQQKQLQRSVICTDSRSVAQALLQRSSSSPLLSNIFQLHNRLTNNDVEIHFIWIPGHSGIQGNERADRLAKEALQKNNITQIPVEYQSIKAAIRHAIMKGWQTQWTNTTQATQLRRIKPKTEIWTSANRENRREEKVLARLRLGHTAYTHAYIYTQDPRPTCATCRHPQTVEHILILCPNYRIQRRQMVRFCTRQQIPFTLATLLDDTHPELLHLLFSFLREAHLFGKL